MSQEPGSDPRVFGPYDGGPEDAVPRTAKVALEVVVEPAIEPMAEVPRTSFAALVCARCPLRDLLDCDSAQEGRGGWGDEGLDVQLKDGSERTVRVWLSRCEFENSDQAAGARREAVQSLRDCSGPSVRWWRGARCQGGISF